MAKITRGYKSGREDLIPAFVDYEMNYFRLFLPNKTLSKITQLDQGTLFSQVDSFTIYNKNLIFGNLNSWFSISIYYLK